MHKLNWALVLIWPVQDNRHILNWFILCISCRNHILFRWISFDVGFSENFFLQVIVSCFGRQFQSWWLSLMNSFVSLWNSVFNASILLISSILWIFWWILQIYPLDVQTSCLSLFRSFVARSDSTWNEILFFIVSTSCVVPWLNFVVFSWHLSIFHAQTVNSPRLVV